MRAAAMKEHELPAKPVTMGTIAFGVFFGQLLFALVGLLFYAVASVLR